MTFLRKDLALKFFLPMYHQFFSCVRFQSTTELLRDAYEPYKNTTKHCLFVLLCQIPSFLLSSIKSRSLFSLFILSLFSYILRFLISFLSSFSSFFFLHFRPFLPIFHLALPLLFSSFKTNKLPTKAPSLLYVWNLIMTCDFRDLVTI